MHLNGKFLFFMTDYKKKLKIIEKLLDQNQTLNAFKVFPNPNVSFILFKKTHLNKHLNKK